MTSSPSSTGRLFVLELSGPRVFSLKPDGSDSRTLVTDGGRLPDGIVVDVEAGHLYWTNMGIPDRNDGFIERADLDGRNRRTIVPQGATHTPKQIHLEKKSGKLYWCDREGMRVMRANLDGSRIETLVQTGEGDADRRKQSNWCVGIAVDAKQGQIYWTQKGADNAMQGRILRANIEIPKGQTAANRSDITVLFDKLPEPIDLEIDAANRVLYWTDRGNPPRGNSVSRTPIDGTPRQEIVMTDLMEGIGVALDVPGNRMFVTDLAGSVYSSTLDGKDKHAVAFAQGNLSGIAYAEIPSEK
jgi:sugar lactone lactonase YvrE